jgi:predicted ABC-type ATPase
LIQQEPEAGATVADQTTLAGRNLARAIEQWRSAGYHVSLISLSPPSAELAVLRVAQRARSARMTMWRNQ